MKARIAAAFSARAAAYDSVANVQRRVAARLAARIKAALPEPPARILEIGCGTGLLSAHLAALYPQAELVLTDISAAMLERAQARLGSRAAYRLMDGEFPDMAGQKFDIIASSLAMQWFADSRGGIGRLAALLVPGGRLMFATLGAESFAEWRAAHAALGLTPGLHSYPAAKTFPWPEGVSATLAAETIQDHHPDGLAFLRALKTLGAGQPVPGHKPLTPAQLRRVLQGFSTGCTASYQVLYGELRQS
jgi:malonyl-CoA O-methyltransferase